MDDRGVRLPEQFPLGICQVDGVGADGLGTENPMVREAVNHSPAILPLCDFLVGDIFGAVNVEAGLRLRGSRDAFAQGLAAERKRSMQSKKRFQFVISGHAALRDESKVLFDPFPGMHVPIPIGNFIAEAGAHAQFCNCCGTAAELPLDGVRRRVMVKDRCRAVPDCFHSGHQRADVAVFRGKLPVKAPPQIAQYFRKIPGGL
jgi:hypothetical protein